MCSNPGIAGEQITPKPAVLDAPQAKIPNSLSLRFPRPLVNGNRRLIVGQFRIAGGGYLCRES
jgi:hypothetical protein